MVEESSVKEKLLTLPHMSLVLVHFKDCTQEPYYDDPVYDMSDNFGAYDDNGKPTGDGILDNPGEIQFYRRVRTGQKDNYNLSIGFSATWSRPLDKKLQALCKEAASTQIALQQQLTANKRLDFELGQT